VQTIAICVAVLLSAEIAMHAAPNVTDRSYLSGE